MQQASSSRPTGGGFIDRSQIKYSFKDDKVEGLFKMLNKGGQLKLPEPKNPEDIGKTDDTRYCLYHRGWVTNQELLVSKRKTASARRRGRFKTENGVEDCHGQYDILHSVWPVASDSYSGVPCNTLKNWGKFFFSY